MLMYDKCVISNLRTKNSILKCYIQLDIHGENKISISYYKNNFQIY